MSKVVSSRGAPPAPSSKFWTSPIVYLVIGLLCSVGLGIGLGFGVGMNIGLGAGIGSAIAVLALFFIHRRISQGKKSAIDSLSSNSPIRVYFHGFNEVIEHEGPASTPIHEILDPWVNRHYSGVASKNIEISIDGRKLTDKTRMNPLSTFITSKKNLNVSVTTIIV